MSAAIVRSRARPPGFTCRPGTAPDDAGDGTTFQALSPGADEATPGLEFEPIGVSERSCPVYAGFAIKPEAKPRSACSLGQNRP